MGCTKMYETDTMQKYDKRLYPIEIWHRSRKCLAKASPKLLLFYRKDYNWVTTKVVYDSPQIFYRNLEIHLAFYGVLLLFSTNSNEDI